VVKNLLVGEDVSYERKIREMIIAARLETTLTKDEILEFYLNCVYLGRGAWGVEVAARSYFGKPAKDLALNEGALLAGLTKGPTYFNPDRQPNRARERLAYVLNRMGEDGMLGTEPHTEGTAHGLPPLPVIVASARPRRDIGFHFVDQVAREARTVAGLDRMTDTSYTVHSTIDQPLQKGGRGGAAGRPRAIRTQQRPGTVLGAEANLGPAILRLEAGQNNSDRRPF
jgi:membrane peptidoglycan carboxypeptidase